MTADAPTIDQEASLLRLPLITIQLRYDLTKFLSRKQFHLPRSLVQSYPRDYPS